MTEINETTRMSTIEWRVVIALWKTASGKTETDFDAITQWSKTPRASTRHSPTGSARMKMMTKKKTKPKNDKNE